SLINCVHNRLCRGNGYPASVRVVLFVFGFPLVRSANIHIPTAEARLAKRDRLFQAAIAGYCSLTRPCGRDAEQLDDLALPLLPLISNESKRFAAATLSKTVPTPHALRARLAEPTLSLSAALRVRSRSLADIDLIGLIGRHGLSNASAIA